MKRLFHDELIKSGNLALFDIIVNANKQISRCRFDIDSDGVKVVFLLAEEKYEVTYKPDTDVEVSFSKLYRYPKEPSLEYFYSYAIEHQELKFVDLVKTYKEDCFLLGSTFKDTYFYKLYSTSELKNPMRELYQASWIDYETQLTAGDNQIYDSVGNCGIWAFPWYMMDKCLNEASFEMYGDRLFVLKTVQNSNYLFDGEEIIGERFEVVDKMKFENLEDIRKLIEILNEQRMQAEKSLNEQCNDLVKYREMAENRMRYQNDTIHRQNCELKVMRIIILILVLILFIVAFW